MDLSEQMRSLVDYDGWADARIWTCVTELDEEDLTSAPLSGVRSISDTLAHMLGTRIWWLSRWKGTDFAMPDVSTLERLQSAYSAVHSELVEFVGGIDGA